ncbi:hypothetical protein UFOVP77_29 [uncultured Caudovirales phage]|uniref:Terminase small subunit n=1 Tax=uncultured Caudovirales phage TaxID=2100421 RepID=A0A6J5KZW3_9CAUD|nr:hypothetical protein UFOVP77_29 [uncultured Caudovirales phage]
MTTKAKAKPGRPPEAVPEAVAEEIIEWISHGKTLREFCRLEGKPAWRTVYDWMIKDKDFAARIAHARELGHDAIAEECLEIIDTQAEMAESWSQAGGSKHRDSAHAGWLKNRAEMRLKLLAKWNPKKYGDKVGVEHSGAIALDAAILEARKRVNQPE